MVNTGQVVGHYRVLEKIGAGGMGEVFRARDERLGRDVALKLIRPASSDSPDHLRRFEQEARAAAALNHPNILAIYDVGFEGTMPYIVSELLEGKTLRQRLDKGPIPLREASDYALQISQGLTAAHLRYVVHRDLKPENLFLTNEGRVKILDFGVAKLQAPAEGDRAIQNLPTVTRSGLVIGTVAYMSPEQLRSQPVDHRSDIFSFGAILYELLTGRRAFSGATEVDTMTAVLREEPPESSLDQAAIPPAYKDIIKHCVEKEPENRFQSARDLGFALQTLSGSSTTSASFVWTRTRRTVRGLPWAVAGILAVAILLLLLQMRFPAPPVSYRRLTFEPGTVYSARFAPDGQSIVYGAAWNSRPVQLFSTIGDSGQAQSLNLQDANLLAISRTNELALVLHGTQTAQLETADGMLAVAPLAGGSPRERLSDVRWADWDSAGNLAVVHYVDGHSRLEYPIGNVLYQSGGWVGNIRFSPQGDHIAFIDHPAFWDDRGSVRVSDMSGHVQILTPQWESVDGLAWSKNGKEVWFTAADKGINLNLMAVTLSGKTRTVLDLPEALTLQDVSADGRVLMALNSRRVAMAAGVIGSNNDVDMSWHDWNIAKDISPDDQFLVFEDSSEAAGGSYTVATRKFDGSLPTSLGKGSAGGISPDGKWAISISTGNPERLTLLPTGAGQSREIDVSGLEHIHNGWARFLADGTEIIVNGNEPGHGKRCYVLDLGGAKPRAITPEGISCGASSPDMRYVAGVGANFSVALYSVAGEQPPRLIPGLKDGFQPVRFSQDSSMIYGYRPGELPSRIYTINIATGKRTVVQQLRPGSPAGVVSVSPVVVSRDGRRFAYSYNQTLSVLYLVSGLK